MRGYAENEVIGLIYESVSHIYPDLVNQRFPYVAVSRGSHDAHLYTDNAASLIGSLSRDVVKSSALQVGQQFSTDPGVGLQMQNGLLLTRSCREPAPSSCVPVGLKNQRQSEAASSLRVKNSMSSCGLLQQDLVIVAANVVEAELHFSR